MFLHNSQFKQLSKSRWIQVYFILVILQTLLSIPILVKTLLNAKNINQTLPPDESIRYQDALFGDKLMKKEYKIIYENILFIVYEVWRLWILTDGVKYQKCATSPYGCTNYPFIFFLDCPFKFFDHFGLSLVFIVFLYIQCHGNY